MRPAVLPTSLFLALAAGIVHAGPVDARQGSDARVLDARARQETLDLIRREKFDLILPGAMRDNDMWIHWIRMGNPDPLEQDLGAEFGVFIFTDRGVDRIERAVFQPFHLLDREAYDIVGRMDDLGTHVRERNLRRIGINSSAWLGVADGMSRHDYDSLVEAIGPEYVDRLVSAEQLITDFRVRRVRRELSALLHGWRDDAADTGARALQRGHHAGGHDERRRGVVGSGSLAGDGGPIVVRSQHAADLALGEGAARQPGL